MKPLNYYIFLFIVLTLQACGQDLTGSKKEIDIQLVNFIEIRNHAWETDTIPVIVKRLTIEEAKAFITKWNNAKPKGLCKFMVRYWVDVTFKNGSKRILRTTSSSIKEDNDECFDLGDEQYVQKLWNKK